MIHVWINKSQFEYDIHSLVKAFYPGEDVKVVFSGEEGAETKKDGTKPEIPERVGGKAYAVQGAGSGGNPEKAGTDDDIEDAAVVGKLARIYIDFEANGGGML